MSDNPDRALLAQMAATIYAGRAHFQTREAAGAAVAILADVDARMPVRCNAQHPDGLYACSLPQNHDGSHGAFENHDMTRRLITMWPRESNTEFTTTSVQPHAGA